MKKILLSCACCLLALGLVTACNDDKVEEVPDEPEASDTEKGGDIGGDSGGSQNEGEGIDVGTTTMYEEVSVLEDGKSYYLGFPYTIDGVTSMYLFNGTTDSYGDYLQCSVVGTEDFKPVEVKVSIAEAEQTDDGGDGDTTKTIGLTFTQAVDGVETEYTIYAWPSSSTSGSGTTQYGEITFIETSLLKDETDGSGEVDAYDDSKEETSGPKDGAVTEFAWDAGRGTLNVTLSNGSWYFSTYQSKSSISLSATSTSYECTHFYTAYEVPNPSSVTVSAENGETSVGVGRSLQLTAAVPDGTYADVVWSSSNEEVATVSAAGLVKGVSEAEAVTITATSVGNPSASGSITLEVTKRDENLIGIFDFSNSAFAALSSTTAISSNDTLLTDLKLAYTGEDGALTSASYTGSVYCGGGTSGTAVQSSAECLKLGKGSNTTGSVSITFNASFTITEVVVVWCPYSASNLGLTVNNETKTSSVTGADHTTWNGIAETVYDGSTTENVSTYLYDETGTVLTIASAKGSTTGSNYGALVHSIEVYGTVTEA